MKHIVIADDHALMRRGIRQLVEEAFPLYTVTEVCNGDDLVVQALSAPCDAVITDLNMPGRTGLLALQSIRKAKPNLPVIIHSINSGKEYAVQAIRNGASAFLTKSSAPEELELALEAVLAGRKYVSACLLEALGGVLEATQPNHSLTNLTPREQEVLRYTGQGHSQEEIAGLMTTSVYQINMSHESILEKLQLTDISQLVQYCTKIGLA